MSATLWLPLALVAYGGFAVTFLLDKVLLTRSIPRPVTYTFVTALLGLGLVVFLPVVPLILTRAVLTGGVVASVVQLAGLLLFFTSLKHGDATRVVPIAGGAVPLFTFLFARTGLGERLGGTDLLAFALLVLAGVVLSVGFRTVRGLPARAWGTAALAGACFAAAFTILKFLYESSPFFSTLITVRLLGALLGVVLLGPLVWARWRRRTRPRYFAPDVLRRPGPVTLLFLGNKAVGAGAGLLQQYAIALGSVTIVNALQGIQYLLLFVLALALASRFPRLLAEERARVSLAQKALGSLLAALGVAMLFVSVPF